MAFPLKMAKVPQDGEIEGQGQGGRPASSTSTDHLDRKPANLSGGQRQRVAMGRAIVRDPSVFLMDEPLSNLDAKLRVQMRTEVSRIQQRLGTTMIYVTHDQTEAMTLGDRVAVMRAGEIQQVASPKELYERPRNLFVAGFIGSPAMNFFGAEVRGGHVVLPFGEVPLPPHLHGARDGRVIAGIRPEAFEDAALAPQHHQGQTFTFDTTIDLVESMGSELYVYFTVQGDRASSAELDEIAADSGAADVPSAGGEGQVVARLDPESTAVKGRELKLWLDVDKLHLFDPDGGARIAADNETAVVGTGNGSASGA